MLEGGRRLKRESECMGMVVVLGWGEAGSWTWYTDRTRGRNGDVLLRVEISWGFVCVCVCVCVCVFQVMQA